MRFDVFGMHNLNHIPAGKEESYRIPTLNIFQRYIAEAVITGFARTHGKELLEVSQIERIEILIKVAGLVNNLVDLIDDADSCQCLVNNAFVDKRLDKK